MFNVGDKVRIKSNLETGRAYNGCYFTPPMEVYKEKTGIITNVYCDTYLTRRYHLDIGDSYYFSNDMLDSIDDSGLILPYRVGDIVRIIDEIPEDLCGIDKYTWSQLLGKSGKIIEAHITADSYMISIPGISTSFWFPLKYFKKESTSTSENSIESVSKLIEYVPEIELSYCKKQIYTV